MKISAGLMLFRNTSSGLEFFLVHPGGPFFAKKDEGWWTIPKGELLENEEPLAAALREFEEETGFKPSGKFIELNPIIQKGGKKVLCWAVAFDVDASKFVSNTFEIEWPPRSGKTKTFPEVDKANWFFYDEAAKLINERQVDFLNQIKTIVSKS
ncbi:NUDIX domain-containing protein [Pedobacter jejuensis]|uniref:NUDIX domain-containing protein n=1 Tax=Pedobacter jejuensis TaxID=1268550 RepID=A0A3N0BXC9_9SPHI|nr:NUDIX domain-containing protein [Pedobacter jejuensis]RNL54288.1 NUDIX domain-containing protein [Pedobacter jejuensis]